LAQFGQEDFDNAEVRRLNQEMAKSNPPPQNKCPCIS
jgi:hypothetical protein